MGFHFGLISGLLFLFGYAVLFGEKSQTHIYLLFMPVAAIILFDKFGTILIYFLLSALLLAGSRMIFRMYDPLYPYNPIVETIERVTQLSIVQNCSSGPVSVASQQKSTGADRIGTGDGTGKRVWILDTGVDSNHPDLLVNVGMSRDFTTGILGGLTGGAAANDLQGHGTHVAGIVAAKNNSIGTLGIAAGAEIVSLKVLDSTGAGNSSTLMQALDYLFVVGAAGEVANLSLGGEASQLADLAVQRVAAKGILVAIAAGNERSPASNYSPGRAEGANIFTISAVDQNDVFASYSNFGTPPVDYAQPGNSILSTLPNGKYGFMTGTSMAAPHMAGILLLKGKNFTTSGMALSDPDGSGDKIPVSE